MLGECLFSLLYQVNDNPEDPDEEDERRRHAKVGAFRIAEAINLHYQSLTKK